MQTPPFYKLGQTAAQKGSPAAKKLTTTANKSAPIVNHPAGSSPGGAEAPGFQMFGAINGGAVSMGRGHTPALSSEAAAVDFGRTNTVFGTSGGSVRPMMPQQQTGTKFRSAHRPSYPPQNHDEQTLESNVGYLPNGTTMASGILSAGHPGVNLHHTRLGNGNPVSAVFPNRGFASQYPVGHPIGNPVGPKKLGLQYSAANGGSLSNYGGPAQNSEYMSYLGPQHTNRVSVSLEGNHYQQPLTQHEHDQNPLSAAVPHARNTWVVERQPQTRKTWPHGHPTDNDRQQVSHSDKQRIEMQQQASRRERTVVKEETVSTPTPGAGPTAGGDFPPGNDGNGILIDLYDYGAKARIGISKNSRPEQQDAFFIFQDGEHHYFGVVDGHGPEGRWVADVLQNKLPYFLRRYRGDMQRAFAATEAFLAEHPEKSFCSGAAIAVVHITPHAIETWHLGDCRALILSSKKDGVTKTSSMNEETRIIHHATSDHSVREMTFHERMSMSTRTGARFLSGNTRVTLPGAPGSLELTRCLGDNWGKKTVLSADPESSRFDRQTLVPQDHRRFQEGHEGPPSEGHEGPSNKCFKHSASNGTTPSEDTVIILASDGVWGNLSNEECHAEVEKSIALEQKAASQVGGTTPSGANPVGSNPVERIMRKAIEKGSTDNISCIAIYANKLKARRRSANRSDDRSANRADAPRSDTAHDAPRTSTAGNGRGRVSGADNVRKARSRKNTEPPVG